VKENRQNHKLAYQEHSCTAPRGVMGRWKRDGNHSSEKKMEDYMANEETGYPVPDPNKQW
jgi:hypothetical protein